MLNKLLVIIFLSLTSLASFGQYKLDYGFNLGASSYLGEMGGGGAILGNEFGATRYGLGGFIRYKLTPKIAVKSALNLINISGSDENSLTPTRRARNLTFKNNLIELAFTGELTVYRVNDVGGSGRYNSDLNLYLFAGLAGVYSNPRGQDENTGDWVSLRQLQSEGVSYSSFSIAIPFGMGFYYSLKRKYRIGLEFGLRRSFSDYLDDTSTRYANDYDGITNKTTPEKIAEVNEEFGTDLEVSNFSTGTKRGSSGVVDYYATATVNFSWAIRGKSKFNKSSKYSLLGKSKRRRRSRAKF